MYATPYGLACLEGSAGNHLASQPPTKHTAYPCVPSCGYSLCVCCSAEAPAAQWSCLIACQARTCSLLLRTAWSSFRAVAATVLAATSCAPPVFSASLPAPTALQLLSTATMPLFAVYSAHCRGARGRASRARPQRCWKSRARRMGVPAAPPWHALHRLPLPATSTVSERPRASRHSP